MQTEVPAFVRTSPDRKPGPGEAPHRPAVLEVHQLWGDLLLETKHFDGSQPVTIGSAVGWRWSILGVQLGWLPQGAHVMARFAPPMWSEVDSDWRNDFYTPDDALPVSMEHTLFRFEGGKPVAVIDDDWTGTVELDGESLALSQLAERGLATDVGDSLELTLPVGARLTLTIGELTFVASRVGASTRVNAPVEHDLPFMALTSLVCTMGLMFGVLMWSMPAPAQYSVGEVPDYFVELALDKPPEPDKPKPTTGEATKEGKKAPGDRGKAGKQDAKLNKAKGKPGAMSKRQRDMAQVQNAGLLGVMSANGPLGAAFDGGLDRSITDAIGGLHGPKGTQIGTGGFDRRGDGFGRNGEAEGTGIGTHGDGYGESGSCDSDEPCNGVWGGKNDGDIGAVTGDPIVIGGLDRALIDEVVKNHMNQIRYCYQRELVKDNTLAGKVVIKFTIAKDGSVSSASKKSSTMNNSAVESCIEGRFLRMQFPEPQGGGIVVVSYPFLFDRG